MVSSSTTVETISRTMEDIEHTKIWLNFWSKIISILTWPLLILFLLLILFVNRKKIVKILPEISGLLRRTKSLKIGPASISFSDELARIEEEQEIYEDSTQYKVKFETSEYSINRVRDLTPNEKISRWFLSNDDFERCATSSPKSAILNPWQSVERMMRSLKIEDDKDFSVPNFLNSLSAKKKISPSQFMYIKDLFSLRNKVVNSIDIHISYSDAIAYRAKCQDAVIIIYSVSS